MLGFSTRLACRIDGESHGCGNVGVTRCDARQRPKGADQKARVNAEILQLRSSCRRVPLVLRGYNTQGSAIVYTGFPHLLPPELCAQVTQCAIEQNLADRSLAVVDASVAGHAGAQDGRAFYKPSIIGYGTLRVALARGRSDAVYFGGQGL